MNAQDLKDFKIDNFPASEWTNSGAKLEDVNICTAVCLQKFRLDIDEVVDILHNGVTSGKHSARAHPEGRAVDVFVHNVIDPMDIVISACNVGFTAVGVYYCEETGLYTFHLEIGPRRFWRGWKKKKSDSWTFYSTAGWGKEE